MELVALLMKRLVKYPDYLNVLIIVCVHKLHLFQLPDQRSAGEVDVSVLLFASNTCDMVVTASRRQTLYLAAVSCCVSCPANVRRHQIKCLVCDFCRCGSNTQSFTAACVALWDKYNEQGKDDLYTRVCCHVAKHVSPLVTCERLEWRWRVFNTKRWQLLWSDARSASFSSLLSDVWEVWGRFQRNEKANIFISSRNRVKQTEPSSRRAVCAAWQ